jgi:hypothetical protein
VCFIATGSGLATQHFVSGDHSADRAVVHAEVLGDLSHREASGDRHR